MRELLKNKCAESNGPFSWSVFIRERTFDAMFRIWKECSAVEESTGYDMHNNTILLLHRHYCFLSLYTSFILLSAKSVFFAEELMHCYAL